MALRQTTIRAGIEALYFSGAHHVLRPLVSGVGAILMLHHVKPPRLEPFQPNRFLEITPAFLEDVVKRLRRGGVDLVPIAEARRRLVEGDFRRRFVVITFDDGYRDNLAWAYPILRKHEVPFTVYVPTSFPDRVGEIWWVALERVIARSQRIGVTLAGRETWFHCDEPERKRQTYEHIYWTLRGFEREDELRAVIRDLASRHDVDLAAICEELCMSWDEIARLAADPLVTIGAHTVNHVMLSKCTDAAARSEFKMGRAVLEAALGVRADHFAYPVGDRRCAGPREFALAAELGFATAVTTRPGVLYPEHRNYLTALPRISLNGEFQRMRHFEVLLSGAATAVWNGFRQVDAA